MHECMYRLKTLSHRGDVSQRNHMCFPIAVIGGLDENHEYV